MNELYEIRKKVDEAVEWNFGYCPNERWFDGLMDKLHALEETCKVNFPIEYAEYDKKYH